MAVLLVEDDIAVRLTLAEFLEGAGLQVLEAEDACEALAFLADPGQCIDVLVTDLDLGAGDNGLLLAAKARRSRPKLPIIYMTGSPERFAKHEFMPSSKVLFKPFPPDVLIPAVFASSYAERPSRRAPMQSTGAPVLYNP